MRKRECHASSWIMALSEAIADHGSVDLHIVTETPLVSKSQTLKIRDRLTMHLVRNAVPLTRRGWPPYLPWDILTGFKAGIRKMKAVICQIHPDMVHGHGTEQGYALAAAACGYPYAVSMQGIITRIAETDPRFRFRVVQKHEQEAVRRGHYFFCRTDFDSEFVHGFNPTARIFNVPEAINPVYFKDSWTDTGSQCILCVSSPLPYKGLNILIEATAIVRRTMPDVTLAVAGDFDARERSRLLRMAASLTGSTQWLDFLGFLAPSDLACKQRECGVFVHPTLEDNSPNAVAEAMVSGMPVIASRTGGLPSMIKDGITGILVHRCDTQELAFAIKRLLTDYPMRQALSKSARAAGTLHWPPLVAEKMINSYGAILSELRAGEIS